MSFFMEEPRVRYMSGSCESHPRRLSDGSLRDAAAVAQTIGEGELAETADIATKVIYTSPRPIARTTADNHSNIDWIITKS